MAAVCGLLSLCTSRPDADDVDYLSRAVYNFENSTQTMFLDRPLAFTADDNTVMNRIDGAYEHFCASIALVSGLQPLHIYHYLMSVIAGSSVPVVWYLLLTRLTGSSGAAVCGVLAVVLVLCADGITHRSVGNFAFVRIWQGKCILMTIVTPSSSDIY